MAKGYLIMDIPKSCDECSLFHCNYSDMCCGGSNNRTIDYPYPKDFRQSWCPLKPMLGKEEMTYENDEYDDGYVFGWNQCLERILSE